MKILIKALILLMFASSSASSNAASHSGLESLPAAQVFASASAANRVDPDRSPLEELDPRQASWKTWLGPIVIGVFAFILVFLIRRFSRAEANRDLDPPE